MGDDSGVSAERQILNLLHLYAERVDAGDFDGVAELFEHADYYMDASTPLRGAAVAEAMRSIVQVDERGRPGTRHLVTNTILDIEPEASPDAGRATARSCYTVLHAVPGLPLQPILAGRYHDRFVRDGDIWRFADRHITADLIGDLSHHLRFDLAEQLGADGAEEGV